MAAIKKSRNVSNKDKLTLITEPTKASIYRQNVPEVGSVDTRKAWLINNFKDEPPKLTSEERSALSGLLKEEKYVDTNLKQFQIKLNSVTSQLRKVMEQINAVHNEQDKLILISCEDEEEDSTNSPSSTSEFVEKQQELMTLIANEEKLQNEQRYLKQKIAEFNLMQQNLDLNPKLSNLKQTDETRNEFDYQRRLYKENKIQKNLIKSYNTALEKIEIQSEEQKQFEADDKIKHKEKVRQMKESYTKLRVFRKETFRRASERKLKAKADEQLRNEKKYENILALKTEIEKQRELLCKEAKERTRKAKERIEKRDRKRNLLLQRGENPFIQEYRIKLKKNEKQAKWAILEQEQIAYHRIRQELLEAETLKRKNEQNRAKWDKFWAEKAEEKRRVRLTRDKELISSSQSTRPTLLQVIQQYENTDGKYQHEIFNFDLFLKENFGNLFEEENSNSRKENYDEYAEFEGEGYTIDFENETARDEESNLLPKLSPASKEKTTANEKKPSKAKDHKFKKVQRPQKVETELEIGENMEISKENVSSIKPSEMLPATLSPVTDMFIVKPPAVIFKDFEIGKTYRKKAKIINKSNTRLKLYFDKLVGCSNNTSVPSSLDLAVSTFDKPPPSSSKYPRTPPNTVNTGLHTVNSSGFPSINDLVKIEFEVPKPICPGLSHEFYLTFKPTVLADCQGEVHLNSPLGSVILPVFCQRKRFDPHLTKEIVTFKKVIGGTSGWMTVKLVNRGAFPGHLTSIAIVDKMNNSSKQYKRTQRPVVLTPRNIPSKKSEDETEQVESIKSTVVASPQSTLSNDLKSTTSKKKKRNTTKSPSTKQSDSIKLQSSKSSRTPKITSSTKLKRTVSIMPEPVKTSNIKNTALNFLNEIFETVTDNVFTMHVKEKKRTLNPGQELTLMIHFQPPAIDYYAGKFELSFDSDDMKTVQLDVEGLAIENPITVDPLNTNFKICLMNFSYQQPVYIQNDSKAAGIIQAAVPLLLTKFVEVVPKKAHSLPGQNTLFSVKFRPQPELLMREGIQKKIFDPVTNIIDFQIPFNLQFPFGNPAPIICTFQALLDDPILEIGPVEINLGNCFIHETIKKKIAIKNNSVVPQHIGFIDLPEFVIILPNYGFTIILPGETRNFEALISFGKSMNAGDIKFLIKVKTLEKKEYVIHVKGVLSYPDLSFKVSKILFPPTCYESTSTAILELISNSSFKSQKDLMESKFEFHVDQNIPISIIPSSGHIGASETVKLLVKFEPKINASEVQRVLNNMLQEKFDTNKNNLNAELKAINKAISEKTKKYSKKSGDLQIPKDGLQKPKRHSKVRPSIEKDRGRSSIEKDQGRLSIEKDEAILSIEKNQEEVKQDKKSSDASILSSVHSTEKTDEPFQGPEPTILIKTVNDIQAIISDGNADLSQSVKILNKRKLFIENVALQAELSFTTTISDQTDEYMNIKKKLISSLKPNVNEFKIPCIISSATHGKQTETMNITVKCPTIQSDLVVLSDATIKFGKLVIGKQTIREIHLHNASIGVILPKMGILNPYGPFIQVNALREIGSEQTFTLKIKFSPNHEGNFEDSFYIYGGESKIVITLVGECTLRP